MLKKLTNLLNTNKLLVALIVAVVALSSLYVDLRVTHSETKAALSDSIDENKDLQSRIELERETSEANRRAATETSKRYDSLYSRMKTYLNSKGKEPVDLPEAPYIETNHPVNEDKEPKDEEEHSVNRNPDILFARDLLCGAGLAEDEVCNNPQRIPSGL